MYINPSDLTANQLRALQSMGMRGNKPAPACQGKVFCGQNHDFAIGVAKELFGLGLMKSIPAVGDAPEYWTLTPVGVTIARKFQGKQIVGNS